MDIQIPSGLVWLAHLLIWPVGSENQWWRTASELRAQADALRATIPDLRQLRAANQGAWTGQTADAVDQQLAKLLEGQNSVNTQAGALEALADSAESMASNVVSAKVDNISNLVITAAFIAWAHANAPVTAGASEAEIPIAEAAAEAASQEIAATAEAEVAAELAETAGRTMLGQLLVKGLVAAGIGAGIGAGQQVITDAVLAAEGHPEPFAKAMGELLSTALSMGAAGVVGGLFGQVLGAVFKDFLAPEVNRIARMLTQGLIGVSSAEAANIAGSLVGGGNITTETLVGGLIGLGEAFSPAHHASVSDDTKSAMPTSVDVPSAADEARAPAAQAGPASDAPSAAASSPANSTTSTTNDGAPAAKTASAPTASALADSAPTAGEGGSGTPSGTPPKVGDGGSAAGGPPGSGPSTATPADPRLSSPARVADGLVPAPSGQTRLEPVASEGVRGASMTPPGAYTAPVSDSPRASDSFAHLAPNNADAETVPRAGPVSAVGQRGADSGLQGAPRDSGSGVVKFDAAGQPAAGRAGLPSVAVADAAATSADAGAVHASVETGAGEQIGAIGEPVEQPVSVQRGGQSLVVAARADELGGKDGARPATGQLAKARLVAGRTAEPVVGKDGARTFGPQRGGLHLLAGGRSDAPGTESGRPNSRALVVASHADDITHEGSDPLQPRGVAHNPLATAEAIGMAAGSEHGHDQAGADASAAAHAGTLTDEPALKNCVLASADELSERYPGREFVVDAEPTREGVPAEALFKAANCAAEDHFVSYAEVEHTMLAKNPDGTDKVPDGSSAIVASKWAEGGPREGAHVFLAEKDHGQLYFVDRKTGERSPWPPPWGEHEVEITAVGYLDEHGDPLHPLDETPGGSAPADQIGPAQGHPTGGSSDASNRELVNEAGVEHEGSSDDNAGERWRHVPAGIDPTGRLAAHALTKWETRLTHDKVERLLKRQDNAAQAVQRVQADARAWPKLTGEEQRALIDKHPEFIGNGIGFPTEARYEANSVTLERCRNFRDGLLSEQRRGTMLTDDKLAFVAHMGQVDTKLDNAAEAAREAGIDEPHLLNFDRHWRVGLCYGESPLEAERLSLVVKTEGQHSDSLPPAVLDRLRSEGNREAWIDWSAPNHEARSNAAAQRAGLGESPLYREVTAWTAARRASAAEGSHPTLPRVHWISDSSTHPGLDPARLRTPDGEMSIVGHRGARHDRPENTWASAKLALEQGADAVEGDTQMTRDGHLVDLHDGKVDRTSTGTGRIAKMRLDQADSFDYGAKHPSAKLGEAQGDTGLLTWEKLLRNVRDYPRPVKAVIELKHPNKFGAEVEQELVRLLKRFEMDSPTSAEDCRAVVISFWPDALRRVWQAAPHVPTVLLLDSRESNFAANFAAAKWAHASAIGPHMLSLRARPDLVAKAADAGFGVLAHGMGKFSKGSAAAEGHAAEFCTSIGVDAVITNEPGLVAHVLRPGLADHTEGLRQPDETDAAATQHRLDGEVDTASADRDPGERWRDVPAGIDPTGRKAAQALTKWDRPRSPKVIERLLNRPGNAAEAVQETQADARAWPKLTGEQQRALIDNQHWFIGNGMGFPTEARYEANSVTLELGRSIRDRLLSEELGGKVLADEELKFVAHMGKVDEELSKATEAAREAGIAEPRIWALDRHWHLILSGGDPVKASRVSLLADREGQLPHVDDFPPAVLDELRSAGQEHEVAWIAWTPPNREPVSDTAARQVRLGESPLYRDFAELTAARRAWVPEGSDPTPPSVHWVSNRSNPLERDPAMLRAADGGMTVVGHRGTPLHRPELTWSGYKLALEHGAGAIEGDVRMTSDGHLVVMHDAKVDRTATGTGRLAGMTRDEADAFEYGARHPSARLGDAQGHTGLVGWDELLGFVRDYPRPVKVFIETKPTKFFGAVERELVRLLNRFDMASPATSEEARAVVISSDPFSLGRVRAAAPHVPTALIWGGGPEAFAAAKRIGASALTINIAELRARPDLVEKAAEAGLGVICACRTSTFGETLRVDAEYCQSLGVPAITVNDPGMVVSWLQPGRAGDG